MPHFPITCPVKQNAFMQMACSTSLGCPPVHWQPFRAPGHHAIHLSCQCHAAPSLPPQAKVLVRLHDVACGMRYLHARNVIHRDLKANNVLLISDLASPFGQRAKVADFGLRWVSGSIGVGVHKHRDGCSQAQGWVSTSIGVGVHKHRGPTDGSDPWFELCCWGSALVLPSSAFQFYTNAAQVCCVFM